MRMYDEIREAPLSFPRGVAVSPLLAQLLYAMLAKDPTARPSMPDIMCHPWVTHNGAHPMHCLQAQPRPSAPPPNFQNRMICSLFSACDGVWEYIVFMAGAQRTAISVQREPSRKEAETCDGHSHLLKSSVALVSGLLCTLFSCLLFVSQH